MLYVDTHSEYALACDSGAASIITKNQLQLGRGWVIIYIISYNFC